MAPSCTFFYAPSPTSWGQITHLYAYPQQYEALRRKHICERECALPKLRFVAESSPNFSPSRVREPPLFLCPPPLLQHKLEDLCHHPRFSSNLVGSKVASWAGAGSRWWHAQGDQAKALQVLTPPLPWVPGWGGSGSGNLPELWQDQQASTAPPPASLTYGASHGGLESLVLTRGK